VDLEISGAINLKQDSKSEHMKKTTTVCDYGNNHECSKGARQSLNEIHTLLAMLVERSSHALEIFIAVHEEPGNSCIRD
jgi:hypothetical protein